LKAYLTKSRMRVFGFSPAGYAWRTVARGEVLHGVLV